MNFLIDKRVSLNIKNIFTLKNLLNYYVKGLG